MAFLLFETPFSSLWMPGHSDIVCHLATSLERICNLHTTQIKQNKGSAALVMLQCWNENWGIMTLAIEHPKARNLPLFLQAK